MNLLNQIIALPKMAIATVLVGLGMFCSALGVVLFNSGGWLLGWKTVEEIMEEEHQKRGGDDEEEQ